MFDYNHYVPILKGKSGEFDAIKNLPNEIRENITPLIDIPRVSLKYPQKIQKEPLEAHFEKVINKLYKAWGTDLPLFVDIFDINPSARTSIGGHPIDCIFKLLKKSAIQGIPTTGLDRDSEYNAAIKKVIFNDRRGACIRLLNDDLLSVDELNDDLDKILKLLEVSRRYVHLLFDLRSLQNADNDRVAKKLIRIINGIKDISRWKTLTLAASGFPESLSDISPDKTSKIKRTEHDLWELILSMSKIIKRVPSFGDYGVVHPDFVEIDPRIIHPSAKIRYTLDDHWLVLKGRSLRKHPDKYKQYHSLAQKLISRKEFMGKSFSLGDDYIAKCANKKVTSGSLQTWVKVDTNHHLTFVTQQVANTVLS